MLKQIDEYLDTKINLVINRESSFDDLVAKIHKECKYESLYKIILERLIMLCLKKRIIFNPLVLLKIDISPQLRLDKDYIFHGQEEDMNLFFNITQGLCLKKGTIFRTLEQLDLEKSKKAFIFELMKKDEEIQDTNFMNDCKLNHLTDFREVFEKELEG